MAELVETDLKCLEIVSEDVRLKSSPGPLEVVLPDNRVYKRDLRRRHQKLPVWSREAARALRAVAKRSTALEIAKAMAWFNHALKIFDLERILLG